MHEGGGVLQLDKYQKNWGERGSKLPQAGHELKFTECIVDVR